MGRLCHGFPVEAVLADDAAPGDAAVLWMAGAAGGVRGGRSCGISLPPPADADFLSDVLVLLFVGGPLFAQAAHLSDDGVLPADQCRDGVCAAAEPGCFPSAGKRGPRGYSTVGKPADRWLSAHLFADDVHRGAGWTNLVLPSQAAGNHRLGDGGAVGTIGDCDVQLFLCDFICLCLFSAGTVPSAQARRTGDGGGAAVCAGSDGDFAEPVSGVLFYRRKYRQPEDAAALCRGGQPAQRSGHHPGQRRRHPHEAVHRFDQELFVGAAVWHRRSGFKDGG